MLYHLFVQLSEDVQVFNVFRYLTFRGGAATMTSLIICFLIGPRIINWLKSKQGEGQPIREDGPESHLITKKGTPTMGGVMILISVSLATLLWADLFNPYVWIVLMVTVGFGLVGFADDYAKVTQSSSSGVSSRVRLGIEGVIAVVAVLGIMYVAGGEEGPTGGTAASVAFPFFKDFFVNLGWFFVPFGMFVIVGAANAVNLTDGLDGLAIVPVMIAAACFGIITYIIGRADFSEYLQLIYVPGTGEVVVFCGALLGAGLGFLWFNAPPAMVFMGDTGSLSLGAALGSISVAIKHEIVLAIIGGIFVMEALSVMMQVASFKLTGKRVFRMAPIHHHFEKLGWKEPTIVIRFWIIAVVLAMVGLSTLKLR